MAWQVAAGSLPIIHPLVGALAGLAVTRPPAELLGLAGAVLEPLLADRAHAALLVMAMVQLMVPHLNTPELVGDDALRAFVTRLDSLPAATARS